MWVEKLARFGYATKGAVYGLIGVLALMAAFGSGGKTTDTQGALHTIAGQPFGQVLLIVIAIGLLGYALWRLVEAWKDPEHKGDDAQGIATRLGYVTSGFIYAALSVNAALIAFGSSGGSGGGSSRQTWTARLMQQPFGRWLVGIVGAIVIGVGIYRIYKAYKIKFRKRLNLRELNQNQEQWVVNICRFGIAARGVVFVMLGFFVLQAAYQSDPNEVRGLDGALQTLAQQPYGKILLGVAALGLVAYAIYLVVQARYRRFKT
ncbi:MAG: DUF1206 domain-containing protein [Cyanophyceae cyanobacterium]